jgi:hypothetical protein
MRWAAERLSSYKRSAEIIVKAEQPIGSTQDIQDRLKQMAVSKQNGW